MPVFLGWGESEIRRQFQPYNCLREYREDRVSLSVNVSHETYELTFEDGWICVEPNEAWMERAISLSVQSYLETEKEAFSTGPHSGRMKWFWSEKKSSRCKQVAHWR